jgi:hypothetical protein
VVADHHHTCWAYISQHTGSVGTAASDQRQAGIIKLQPLLPTGHGDDGYVSCVLLYYYCHMYFCSSCFFFFLVFPTFGLRECFCTSATFFPQAFSSSILWPSLPSSPREDIFANPKAKICHLHSKGIGSNFFPEGT